MCSLHIEMYFFTISGLSSILFAIKIDNAELNVSKQVGSILQRSKQSQ